LERTSSRDFVFRFTVAGVVCPELLWVKYGSICDDAEQVFEGLPGWWCNTDEFPLAPDPAQLGSGFPFQGQVGGKGDDRDAEAGSFGSTVANYQPMKMTESDCERLRKKLKVE
jgi:hypothetical protein